MRNPGRSTTLGYLDFNFDPRSGNFATAFHGSGGFGLVFDDWGRSFVTHNINHIQHRFIPERYLRRFPGFLPVKATGSISDHGDMARIYPVSVAVTRPNHPEQSGHFSAAGGMGYIGWNGFGPDLYGSVLVCDVVGNLVHRDVIQEDGPVFRAVRANGEEKAEFLASRDNSFRPVGLELGPDGALYLIDMQRDVIEHPDYIPEKVRTNLDLRAGEDRGRIYRVAPKGTQGWADLGSAETATLVSNLSDPNQWRRMTAQRLLVERREKGAIKLLKELALSGKEPKGRLHALWTLQGLDALDESTIEHALSDPHPGIRENALLLAEPLLASWPKLAERVLARAADESARVRFQAALTLGQVEHPGVRDALQSILLRDYEQRWTRIAVLSSFRSGVAEILSKLNVGQLRSISNAAKLDLIREVADLAVARDGSQGLSAVIRFVAGPPEDEALKLAALEGLNSGLARSNSPLKPDSETTMTLDHLIGFSQPALASEAFRVARTLSLPETESQRKALNKAIEGARGSTRPEAARVSEIRLLGLGNYPAVKNVLFSLLEDAQPTAIQEATVSALKEFNEPDVAKNLIAQWRTFAPSLRPVVLDMLLRRQSYQAYLVEALEAGRLTVGELNLDLEQRRRLLWRSAPEIRARAAKLIGDGEYSNRKTVVEQWLAKLPPTGEPQRGKAVFEQRCAPCHLVGTLGHRVGPELTGMFYRSVEDLLSNILDPNMAINPGYITYNCETVSGELESGILAAESAEAVTLLQASEKKVVIARKNIKRLQSSGLSLMPEGLEAGLTPTDLRDLIAFLQESH